MKILLENPSLARDIGLQLLPHEKLKSCRLVNSTIKQLIDSPNFWIEKFRREKNMTNVNITKWVKLIQQSIKNEQKKLVEKLVRIMGECYFKVRNSNLCCSRFWRCKTMVPIIYFFDGKFPSRYQSLFIQQVP